MNGQFCARSLNTEGVRNICVFGGVLNGGTERRVPEHCYEPFTKETVRLYNSSNITIEDVVLHDFKVQGVTVNGVPITMEHFDVIIENAKGIQWEN